MTTITNADGGTEVTTHNADGSVSSVTGTAVTPEFTSYSVETITMNGVTTLCRTKTIRTGSANSPRFEKTFVNGFGETVRVERSGFNGAVLVTENAYDACGHLISTTETGNPSVSFAYDVLGVCTNTTRTADGVSRLTEHEAGFVVRSNDVWHLNRKVVRTNDATLAPLVTESYDRVSGITTNRFTESCTVDVRGNTNTTWSVLDASTALTTKWARRAECTNISCEIFVDGLSAQTVDAACVTNTVAYDAFRYESYRDLLTGVTNYLGETVYSSYACENDVLGRRTSRNDEQYGYNTRNELTSATGSGAYTYEYDDIGNRKSSTEPGDSLTYVANQLNQYASVSNAVDGTFQPTFDADGNQTLVKTATGIWSVTYNGENRPVCWSNGTTVVTMDFDSMGRRTFDCETVNGVQTVITRFFYDGYLMIQQFDSNAPYNVCKEFVWDPTELVATKPLCFRQDGETDTFLTHDGNKNVTDLIRVSPYNDSVGHYDYAPFGALRSQTGDRAAANPFRFSSEFSDDSLGLVCYNYRHYNPLIGNWSEKDPIGERGGSNLYGFLGNYTMCQTDYLGCGWSWRYGFPVFLYTQCCDGKEYDPAKECCIDKKKFSRNEIDTGVSYYCHRTRWYYPVVQPIIRPFSPSQFMVDHCWFNIDGFRFGAYPNARFEDKKSIRDESTITRNNYNTGHENSFWTSGGPVRLSPCEYDIEKFKKCVRDKYDDTSFQWTMWNNCRDFVIDSVRECKEQSKRK